MRTVSSEVTQRPAEVGELCTCGRQAVVVYLAGRFGPSGDCCIHDGGAPAFGVCTFCGDTVDHIHYALAERAAWRNSTVTSGNGEAQSGRCPLYRLRLADPLPELHPESVRPFDQAGDRLARAPRRLRGELDAIVVDARRAAGHDQPDDLDDDQALSLEIAVEQIMAILAAAGDRAAVQETLTVLAEACGEAGVPEATGDWLLDLRDTDPVELVGRGTWESTDPVDRPLLVARLAVRRALNPEVPAVIHREWWA